MLLPHFLNPGCSRSVGLKPHAPQSPGGLSKNTGFWTSELLIHRGDQEMYLLQVSSDVDTSVSLGTIL